jgi:hypothetical protein
MLFLPRASRRPLRLRHNLIGTVGTSRHPKRQTSDGHMVPRNCSGRETFKVGSVKSESSREMLSIDALVMSASSKGDQYSKEEKAAKRIDGEKSSRLQGCLVWQGMAICKPPRPEIQSGSCGLSSALIL